MDSAVPRFFATKDGQRPAGVTQRDLTGALCYVTITLGGIGARNGPTAVSGECRFTRNRRRVGHAIEHRKEVTATR